MSTSQEIRFRIVVEDAGSAAADQVDRSLATIGQTAEASGRRISGMGRQVSEMFRDAGSQANAGQRLLQSLTDQVNQAGMTASEYQRYQAALLGVGREAGELIGQLDRLTAQQAAEARATAEAAAAKRAAAAADQQAATARATFLRQLQDQAALQGKSTAEVMEYRAAQLGVSREAAPFIASLKAQNEAVGRLGVSTGQTTAAMRMLPAQLSDVVTQLAGGQSPFLVLTQQGLQTRDMFGSFRAAGQGVLSVLTPMRVLVGGTATALGVLGLAAFQGYRQVDSLTMALAANGNAAGVTRGQLDAMAERIASLPGGAIGPAREALYQLAGAGTFVGGNLELAGRAALALGRLTGQSADEAIKSFDGMRNGVAQWAVQANKSYNFLNVETYKLIRSLEAQGRTQDAVKVALEAMSTSMEARAVPALGTLQRAVEGVKAAGSGFWDWLMGIGRPDTPEQALASAKAEVEKIEQRIKDARNSPVRTAGLGMLEREREEARQRVANLQEQLRMQQRGAERLAADASKNSRGLEEAGSGHASRMLAIQSAQADLSAAQRRAADEAEQRALEAKHRQMLISSTTYAEQMRALLTRGADDEVKAAEAAVARAREQPVGSREEAQGREAAVIQAQIKVVEAKAKRELVLAEIAAGKFDPKPREVLESPTADFRRSEAQQTAALEAGWAERLGKTRDFLAQLVDGNRSANIELISDDRARGLAMIANDERALRERLDLAVLSVEDRKQAEETLAQWRTLREQQLTEALKPEWQRQAELWADTTKYMKQSYDSFLTGFVDRGRSAFDEFVRTGKVSTSTLTSFIRQEFARMAYERFLASSVRQLGSFLFDTLLGTGTKTGDAGYGDYTQLGKPPPTVGGAAFGGSLAPNTAWVVGERGPEVLVMGRAGGVVVPNHALGGAGGGQPVINQTFTIQGNEDPAKLYALASLTRESTLAAVVDARRRGNPAFG